MKKLVILFLFLVGLASFVYLYEIEGQKAREEAERLEKSLLRLKQEEIQALEIARPDEPAVRLEKEGESWMLKEPLQALADGSTVDSLLRNLADAEKDQSIETGPDDWSKFGLDQPRITLNVYAGEKNSTLRLGNDDYTGTRVYVLLDGQNGAFLTSDSILSAADKSVTDWRSKKVLSFDRSKLQQVEILRGGEALRLSKEGEKWKLEAPIQDDADGSAVTSLLSSLEFAQIQEFVDEQPENLEPYGLHRPELTVRLQEEGKESWKILEIGGKQEDNYLARDPQRSPVFSIKSDLYDALVKDLWEFRNKDVVDLDQDQVAHLLLSQGESEISIRHEEFKWLIEKPEEHKDKEALAYKFWYPIEDIQFESIREGESANEPFPTPQVILALTAKDGAEHRYEFARQGDAFVARNLQSGRVGAISEEDYEKLQVKVEDLF